MERIPGISDLLVGHNELTIVKLYVFHQLSEVGCLVGQLILHQHPAAVTSLVANCRAYSAGNGENCD